MNQCFQGFEKIALLCHNYGRGSKYFIVLNNPVVAFYKTSGIILPAETPFIRKSLAAFIKTKLKCFHKSINRMPFSFNKINS